MPVAVATDSSAVRAAISMDESQDNNELPTPSQSAKPRFGQRMKSFFKGNPQMQNTISSSYSAYEPTTKSVSPVLTSPSGAPVSIMFNRQSVKHKSLPAKNSPARSPLSRESEFYLFAKHTGSSDAVMMFENLVRARVLMADGEKHFNDATVSIELVPQKTALVLRTQTGHKVAVQIEEDMPSPSVKRESLNYWLNLGQLVGRNGKVPPNAEFLQEVQHFVVFEPANFAHPVTMIFAKDRTAVAFVQVLILLQMFKASHKK